MDGSIRQRGRASWELRVYAGRDAETGRKLWMTRTVRGSRSDAQRELRALATLVDNGLAGRSRATVGELLDRWLQHTEADFSPKTVKEVRGYVERTIRPALGEVRLTKLRAHDIDDFYHRLRESGGSKGQPLAPATIRRIHGILHRALAQGVRWGFIGTNPASAASPLRVPVKELTLPTPAEVRRLFDVAGEHRPDLACFVLLAASTGARRSELVALRWSSVDLGRGELTISRGIVRGLDGFVEKDTKTHSARRVSLDPTTVSVLHAHHDRAVEAARCCGVILPADALVFSSAVDGSVPWQPESVSRSFARLCRQADVENVRLHDLRHYVAARLLSSGVDVRTVAGRLGHRNAATTLNVYSHFLPESDRDAAALLGRMFDASPEESPGAESRRDAQAG